MREKIFPILILWFFIAFFWSFYRYFFRFSELIDELIFKPLIFLLPVFWFVKFKEKKTWRSLGITKRRLGRSILIGLSLGLIFVFEGILTGWFKNKGLTLNPKNLSIGGVFGMGFISLATGFSEEVLNRGFLMNRFWRIVKGEVLANFLSTLLFTFFHLPMAIFVFYYSGKDLSEYLFLIFVLGLTDGFVFGRTKNIFAPTVSHALWNWSVVLVR